MLFCIDMKHPKRESHVFENRLYQTEGRIAFKDQKFSAPMDCQNVTQQLLALEKKETHIALPGESWRFECASCLRPV